MPQPRRETTTSTAAKDCSRKESNLQQENTRKALKVAPVQSLGWLLEYHVEKRRTERSRRDGTDHL